MQIPPRTPPRFVPTLTEVVQNAPLAAAEESGNPWPASQPVGLDHVEDAEPAGRPASPEVLAHEALEDQIIHRVMQRVDLSLERRLQDAVSAMVLAQTQQLVPRLREEIEFVVRQSVSDAVADELATRSPRP